MGEKCGEVAGLIVDAVAGQRAGAGPRAHLDEGVFWRGGEGVDGPGQGFGIACGDEPAAIGGDEFGDARDGGGNDGAAFGHRLHQHDGKAFGEGRQDQGGGGVERGADPGFVLPAGEVDMGAKPVTGDGGGDLGAQRAVADEGEVEAGEPGGGDGHRLDQEGQALLFGKAPDGEEARAGGKWRGRAQAGRVDAAMDDMEARPELWRDPAGKLAAAKAGDGHGKGRAGDLFAQGQGVGGIEFLWPMGGEGIARAAEGCAEHGDCGAVGAEMGVQMGDAKRVAAAGKMRGLDQIDHVAQPSAGAGGATRAARAAGESEAEGAEACAGARGEERQRGGDEGRGAEGEDMFGACIFGEVIGLDQGGAVGAERETVDGQAQPFQRRDFAPDEGL